MPPCARRWNGLPPPSPVLSGSLTIASAATCGPMLALPHNNWIDGSHACGTRSHVAESAACRRFFRTATTGYVWRAKPVSTRAPGAPARRSGSGQPCLCMRLASRRFDLSRPAFFFEWIDVSFPMTDCFSPPTSPGGCHTIFVSVTGGVVVFISILHTVSVEYDSVRTHSGPATETESPRNRARVGVRFQPAPASRSAVLF